ncbi:MAG: sulfurtransferase [Methylococcales bacterium]|nr:sulfurtransferase [Methylococcales bacterium]
MKVTHLKCLIGSLIFWVLFSSSTYAVTTQAHALITEEKNLLEHIDDTNTLIIDVRKNQEYRKLHIKNAINLPVADTFSKGKRNDLIAPLSEIVKLFGQAGIDKDVHIILYDDGLFIDAGRFFWILEMLGQDKVSILNSGFNNWKLKGNPISSTERKLPPVIFIPSVSPDKVATFISVRVAVDNLNHALVDVRPTAEYRGIESKTGYFGHIPSAINIPFDLNLDISTSKLKPRSELADLYKILNKEKPVTVYCNKGKQSALSYFALRYLGYKVSAYDGSWFEWGRKMNFPMQPLSIERNKKLPRNE